MTKEEIAKKIRALIAQEEGFSFKDDPTDEDAGKLAGMRLIRIVTAQEILGFLA